MISLFDSESLWPASTTMKAAPVMNPSPPTNIRPSITTCPNPVQASAVSTTIRPVTVTAETHVKRACVKGVKPPSTLEMGKTSSAVPSTTSPMKPYTRSIGDAGPRTETVRVSVCTRTGSISEDRGLRATVSPGRSWTFLAKGPKLVR